MDILVILFVFLILFVIVISIEKEPFIVADAQDFHNYEKHKKLTMMLSDRFEDTESKSTNQCDYKIKGYNYVDYSDRLRPQDIDRPILSLTTRGLPLEQRIKNIPVGYNYAFQ